MSDKRRPDKEKYGKTRERSRSRSPHPRNPEPDKKPENIALDAKKRLKNVGIQMKLAPQNKSNKPKVSIASVFNQDSDSEPEEMPPEARMRMRNIGRDTPTSSGPNSFGKTKQGFSDAKKLFEKNLKEALNDP